MSWMHSAAESARWSNWPGRYSTAKAGPWWAGSSLQVSSTGGSLNTVPAHWRNSSSEMPSTS